MAVKLFLRQYSPTLAICGIFFVAFMPWYFVWGMTMLLLISTGILALLILVIPLWFIIRIGLVFEGRCSGKKFGIQVACLSVTFFVAIPLAHLANGYVEQVELKSLKEKIELYINQHGILPTELGEMGISAQDKKIHYQLNQKRAPRLTYSSYSICVCLYVYDFQKHDWYTKSYNFSSVSESEYWDDVRTTD
jgi:hypothetical protein